VSARLACVLWTPKLPTPKLYVLHEQYPLYPANPGARLRFDASAGARARRSIVGDLDAPEVDALVLRYLGTIAPRPPAAPPAARPIELMAPFGERRQQTWHLQARGAPRRPARRAAPSAGTGWHPGRGEARVCSGGLL